MPFVNFFYVLNDKFVPFLKMGMRLIRVIYPNAKVFAYDLSESPSDDLIKISKEDALFFHIHWKKDKWIDVPLTNTIEFKDLGAVVD